MENTIKIIFLIVLTIIIIYNLFHKKQINKDYQNDRTDSGRISEKHYKP